MAEGARAVDLGARGRTDQLRTTGQPSEALDDGDDVHGSSIDESGVAVDHGVALLDLLHQLVTHFLLFPGGGGLVNQAVFLQTPGLAVPVKRDKLALFHSQALLIQSPQIKLSAGVPLFRRLGIPDCRRLIVGLAAQAALNAPDPELDKALSDFIFTGGAAANTLDEKAAAARELAGYRTQVIAMPAATGIESPSMLIGPTMTGSAAPSSGRCTIWMLRSRPRELDSAFAMYWRKISFGRTPIVQGTDGRDHNQFGFTVWLAGGGVKPGTIYGATDEWGYKAIENRAEMHDLHATILRLIGFDHEKLTFRHEGRDHRLTDLGGRVVDSILA